MTPDDLSEALMVGDEAHAMMERRNGDGHEGEEAWLAGVLWCARYAARGASLGLQPWAAVLRDTIQEAERRVRAREEALRRPRRDPKTGLTVSELRAALDRAEGA